MPKVLEFRRHAGETLLGLGEGLGTDWLQYACHGAKVIAAGPSQEQLGLIRKNFEFRGQAGRFVHAPPHALPIDAASIDVVCVQGLLHELERPAAVIDEVYRVLRPGGEVIVVAPAKFDATFWCNACFPGGGGSRAAAFRRRQGDQRTGAGGSSAASSSTASSSGTCGGRTCRRSGGSTRCR